MKINTETRINAVLLQEKGKDVILITTDQNMTLGQYLEKTIPHFLLNKQVPNPLVITELDYQVVDFHTNKEGHKFTSLLYKSEDLTCSVLKLELSKN